MSTKKVPLTVLIILIFHPSPLSAQENCQNPSFNETKLHVSKSHFATLKEKTITGCLNEETKGMSNAFRITCKESEVQDLKHNAISNLHHLKFLIFSHNNLTFIERSALVNLTSLELLHIVHNKLEVILRKNFYGLPIKILDLQHNKISFIQEDAFYGLNNLEMLVLHHNFLNKWSSNYLKTSTPNLHQLDLSHNLIRHVENYAFSELKNLKMLHLTANRICLIEENTLQGEFNLDWLCLRDNFIQKIKPFTVIGSGQRNLTRTLSLDLRGNRLTHLPVKFLVNLRALELFIGGNPFVCPCLEVVSIWSKRNNATVDCLGLDQREFCLRPRNEKDDCFDVFDEELVWRFYNKTSATDSTDLESSNTCAYNPKHHRKYHPSECLCS